MARRLVLRCATCCIAVLFSRMHGEGFLFFLVGGSGSRVFCVYLFMHKCIPVRGFYFFWDTPALGKDTRRSRCNSGGSSGLKTNHNHRGASPVAMLTTSDYYGAKTINHAIHSLKIWDMLEIWGAQQGPAQQDTSLPHPLAIGQHNAFYHYVCMVTAWGGHRRNMSDLDLPTAGQELWKQSPAHMFCQRQFYSGVDDPLQIYCSLDQSARMIMQARDNILVPLATWMLVRSWAVFFVFWFSYFSLWCLGSHPSPKRLGQATSNPMLNEITVARSWQQRWKLACATLFGPSALIYTNMKDSIWFQCCTFCRSCTGSNPCNRIQLDATGRFSACCGQPWHKSLSLTSSSRTL